MAADNAVMTGAVAAAAGAATAASTAAGAAVTPASTAAAASPSAGAPTSPLSVLSEIGQLRRVCLHRPGDELLNLIPVDLDRLLFDDTPFLELAQEEHDNFANLPVTRVSRSSISSVSLRRPSPPCRGLARSSPTSSWRSAACMTT